MVSKQASSKFELLVAKNKQEQKQFRSFAKEHDMVIQNRATLKIWLVKQKEHTLARSLKKKTNLCSPHVVPKIRAGSQAKVTDMMFKHRPRIFSTKHRFNYSVCLRMTVSPGSSQVLE